jgi:enoyl-[acyl-carrier protein] reductase I
MVAIDLTGRNALVLGVANHRSLSWAIAQSLHQAGARVCLTYAGERLRPGVEELAAKLAGATTLELDVTNDASIAAVHDRLASDWGSLEILVHGVAFANKEDLEGRFVDTSRQGFMMALDVSAYSFLNVTRHVLPLLETNGASLLTLSYLAAERAVPSYNVMGSAKAVLEQSVRQLAWELGPKKIRVNAVSAGPVSTLAARGIHGFVGMQKHHAEKAPLQRNITKEEVGSASLFLLSDLASGITGEVLYVDAGYRIMGA